MTFDDFCDTYDFEKTETAREIFDKARLSVANEILSLFGISGGTNELNRFLDSMEERK